MDQFIRLTIALTQGAELAIAHCESCHGALLVERGLASRRLCLACQQDALNGSLKSRVETPAETVADQPARSELAEACQQSLF